MTNQLTYAIDNLSNVVINAEATRSRLEDTDYAKATSELARTQIIQQAGTAMLAQAISYRNLYCSCCRANLLATANVRVNFAKVAKGWFLGGQKGSGAR